MHLTVVDATLVPESSRCCDPAFANESDPRVTRCSSNLMFRKHAIICFFVILRGFLSDCVIKTDYRVVIVN